MQTHLSQYQAAGAQVLVIVGQRAEKVGDYLRAHTFGFPILVDPDRSVIKRYGVYHRLGLTAFNIARPATFIIDRSRRLRFVHIGQGQSDRPDHQTLMTELLKPPLLQSTSPPPAADAPRGESAPP